MKNFWTEAVVNRNADRAGFDSPQAYLLSKQREFEAQTGVRWSVSAQRGGYAFDPVDDGVPVPAAVDKGDADALFEAYDEVREAATGYATYLDVHEASGVSLRGVMGAVRFMERQGKAVRTVNRMGKAHAFKIRGWGREKA